MRPHMLAGLMLSWLEGPTSDVGECAMEADAPSAAFTPSGARCNQKRLRSR